MNTKHSDTNNLIIALLLSLLILGYWQYFIEGPRKAQEELALKTKVETQQIQKVADVPEVPKSRDELLSEAPNVVIKSDRLNGSFSLKGLRFNNLALVQYHETLDPKSPQVVLFSPSGDANSYFAEFGWLSADKSLQVPTEDTVWSADSKELTPTHPVNLTWKNSSGVAFHVQIALDDKYMFTIAASAEDSKGGHPLLQNYAYINRVYDISKHPAMGILHEGPLGVFDGILKEVPYKKLIEQKDEGFEANSGWMGVTDKYWLSAIIPPDESFSAHMSYYESKDRAHYQVEYIGKPAEEMKLHLFAGAKEMALLDAYSAKYNIARFDHAVDLGLFDFLTKPIFKILAYFYGITGNFGIAILLLTVLVKLIMYPLASKSFQSMNKMKIVQPRMAEIRERHKDDKVKMNQEIMELYKREKVNPASGCLPMIVQIPVFFSLYKVLYVTLEMRHAPFFGWIHDLSASDPTNLFTLFGLLNWLPPTMMHLGIWPMIMCCTMIIQQHQSPPPPDPVQAKMMKFLPLVFLFLFSNFAAGLVIYWSWSNTLTILQQWYIKKKYS